MCETEGEREGEGQRYTRKNERQKEKRELGVTERMCETERGGGGGERHRE